MWDGEIPTCTEPQQCTENGTVGREPATRPRTIVCNVHKGRRRLAFAGAASARVSTCSLPWPAVPDSSPSMGLTCSLFRLPGGGRAGPWERGEAWCGRDATPRVTTYVLCCSVDVLYSTIRKLLGSAVIFQRASVQLHLERSKDELATAGDQQTISTALQGLASSSLPPSRITAARYASRAAIVVGYSGCSACRRGGVSGCSDAICEYQKYRLDSLTRSGPTWTADCVRQHASKTRQPARARDGSNMCLTPSVARQRRGRVRGQIQVLATWHAAIRPPAQHAHLSFCTHNIYTPGACTSCFDVPTNSPAASLTA